MRKTLKALAVLLCAVFTFQVVEIGVLAASPLKLTAVIDDGTRAAIPPTKALAKELPPQDAPESPIEQEMVSLREEAVKHFRKADGSFLAVTYCLVFAAIFAGI